MEKKIFDYKIERAAYSQKFGIDFDETSLAVLFAMDELRKAEQNNLLEKAIAKLNGKQKQLEVSREHPYWQSFFFGLGKFGLAICITVLLLFFLVNKKLDSNNENVRLLNQIQWHLKFYRQVRALDSAFTTKYVAKYPYPIK